MRRFILLVALTIAMATNVAAQTANNAAEDADAKYATELLKAGDEAPDFTLADPNGVKHSLSELRGNYVVLDFWATWCPDCRKDVPEVKRLYNEYGQKVKFVSVSFDFNKDNWTKYIKENDMPWLHVSDLKKMRESAIAQLYKIHWIPSVYIIGPDGKVVLSTVMIEKAAAKLAEIGK